MADIGYFALLLALVGSIYSVITFIVAAKGKHPAWNRSARISLLAVCGLVSISVAALVYALVTHDFQIEYVTSYTSRDLSLGYRLSALWAGNNGSLLFWAWVLSVFATVALLTKRHLSRELLSYASSIIIATEAFFLILLLTVSNPFQKLLSIPLDGMGLNPMLENPAMILHPPVILAGYAGFTIPFAFAIAALLSWKLGDGWLTAARKWMLLSWLLLGVGNIIGAWWAYVELGWGGYWAWDPVENAGLMPWLVATASLHSMIMQRRRRMFKVWNMVLVVMAFSLAIFGTFLTRSGIIGSVHAYSESALGPFFLLFLALVLCGSLGLIYHRYDKVKGEIETESLISRDSIFLLNNLLLVGSAFIIFLGTIFPVISEALSGVKIGVGESFFNYVNGPIFLAIIFLAGVCTVIGWRRASMKVLLNRSLGPLVSALVLAAVLFFLGIREWPALIAFPVCWFVISTLLYGWFHDIRTNRRTKEVNYLKAFWNSIGENRIRYGACIVHLAMALIAIGVTGSSFFEVEKEARLKAGESMAIQHYVLTYEDIKHYQTQSTMVVRATLSVSNNGKFVGKLTPEKYFHQNFQQPVTEVAIRSTLREDLYVILAGWNKEGAVFKVLVNPLVSWIWLGGGIFLLGGLIVFWPKRREITSNNDEPIPESKEEVPDR